MVRSLVDMVCFALLIWEQTWTRVEQEHQRRQEQLQVEKVQQHHQVQEREQQRRSRGIGR